MNILNIIGKKVISIYDCQCCGYILNINLNSNNKFDFCIVADDNNDMKYKLNTSDILNIDNEYITIKNKTKLTITSSVQCNNIVYNNVISYQGKSYNKLKDIKINNKYYITELETETKKFLPKNVLYIGNGYIIINDSEKVISKSIFKPIQTSISTQNYDQVVEIMPQHTLPTPIKVNSTTSLLGKRLNRDLIATNGEIIARKNSVINIPLLNTVKQYNMMKILIQSTN